MAMRPDCVDGHAAEDVDGHAAEDVDGRAAAQANFESSSSGMSKLA
jgi:hypothetical protein